jgi:hypothetical protein
MSSHYPASGTSSYVPPTPQFTPPPPQFTPPPLYDLGPASILSSVISLSPWESASDYDSLAGSVYFRYQRAEAERKRREIERGESKNATNLFNLRQRLETAIGSDAYNNANDGNSTICREDFGQPARCPCQAKRKAEWVRGYKSNRAWEDVEYRRGGQKCQEVVTKHLLKRRRILRTAPKKTRSISPVAQLYLSLGRTPPSSSASP